MQSNELFSKEANMQEKNELKTEWDDMKVTNWRYGWMTDDR